MPAAVPRTGGAKDAEQGDGLAEAVQGKMTGDGLTDEQDTADGEDAGER